MVYFDSWDEFAAAVEQLCVAEPNRVKSNSFQKGIESYIQASSLNKFQPAARVVNSVCKDDV